jgi:Uma2 family endonuclease
MSTAVQRHLFTVEDYHKMGELGILRPDARVELLNGEILEMSPINSPHAGCVNRLNALLHRLFGAEAVVSIQNPLRLDDFSEPEPDVMLLRPAEDFYAERHPQPADVLLLIEVAESSLDTDRELKGPQYARAGIAHYWIVNLPERCIEVYSQPADGQYRAKRVCLPGETIEVLPFEAVVAVETVLPIHAFGDKLS